MIIVMCQEEREEEDLSALKAAWTHQYKDSKTTQKIGGRLITATWNNNNDMRTHGTTISRKQMQEENHFMDVLSD